ncbi:MAG: oligosaccharide repeat unit polymerase [Candidatus Parvarchaeota archaeon]|nr:oligosaccharide repeat unit polymerase [Candidatus Rehaiarchaeum fermentans]
MRFKKIHKGLFIFVLSVILVFNFFQYFVPDRVKVLLIGLLISILSITVVLYRIKIFGISDPVLIFSLIFLFYNGLVLINFSYFLNYGVLALELFPTSFTSNVVLKASFFALTSYFGFLGGVLILQNEKRLSNDSSIKYDFNNENLNYDSLILLSVIFYFLGIVMFFLTYSGIKGFVGSLSINRVARLNTLAQESSLPYPGFIFVSIAIMFYVSLCKKSKLFFLIFSMFFSFLALLLILQGDRRFLVYSIIILIVIWGVVYGDEYLKKLSFSRLIPMFLLVLFGYLLFSFFEKVRFLIPIIVSKMWTWNESLAWIKTHISIDWFMPARTEFGAPYFSLLYYLQNNTSRLYGSSYAFALPYLIPRRFYPGIKPPFLADVFSLRIHDEFMSTSNVVKGWGYSPIAEAFQNFGLVGPFLVFFVLAIFIVKLSSLKKRGFWGTLTFALLMPELLNFNRMCFAPVFQEAVFIIIPEIILYIIYEILQSLKDLSANESSSRY